MGRLVSQLLILAAIVAALVLLVLGGFISELRDGFQKIR